MIFGAENPIQLARFRAVALAEGTLLCKAKQRRSRWSSADAKADVANGFGAVVVLTATVAAAIQTDSGR
jgi:hypothetical protein